MPKKEKEKKCKVVKYREKEFNFDTMFLGEVDIANLKRREGDFVSQ